MAPLVHFLARGPETDIAERFARKNCPRLAFRRPRGIALNSFDRLIGQSDAPSPFVPD